MSTRILIIEDNQTNLDLMVYLLKAFGYESLSAQDGESGVDLARAERPELVLCDIQLPAMSGYEVAQQLRNDPATRDLRIVAVTA